MYASGLLREPQDQLRDWLYLGPSDRMVYVYGTETHTPDPKGAVFGLLHARNPTAESVLVLRVQKKHSPLCGALVVVIPLVGSHQQKQKPYGTSIAAYSDSADMLSALRKLDETELALVTREQHLETTRRDGEGYLKDAVRLKHSAYAVPWVGVFAADRTRLAQKMLPARAIARNLTASFVDDERGLLALGSVTLPSASTDGTPGTGLLVCPEARKLWVVGPEAGFEGLALDEGSYRILETRIYEVSRSRA